MNLIRVLIGCLWFCLSIACSAHSRAQESLSVRLQKETIGELVDAVEKFGDPRRGAVAFYLPAMNCTKCHDASGQQLGPNLAEQRDATTRHLIESVLKPSAKIRDGYQTVRVAMEDGRTLTGVHVSETEETLTVGSIEFEQPKVIRKDNVEEWAFSKTSSMPVDLANQLADRQQFLDLISYLAAIAKNPSIQSELKPATAVLAPLPEYESRVDHAGLIQGLDDKAFERGEEIYRLRCASCHGTIKEEGSMPTSLRFASGKFKHGSDPLTMYKTLTHGYGMMNPQRWMVPQQKYEVIHYIREHFLKPRNENQLFEIDESYLASLPKGDTRGPKPVMPRPWTMMDYGPSMFNTVEVSKDGSNIAQKGIVVRLDGGPGGVESGSHWMMYEHDTMRVAAAWSGKFIDWEGIHFNGTHGRHPSVAGDVHFANPTAPGFGRPGANSSMAFVDNRVVGRDGKHYGPLPSQWARFDGMYRFGNQSILKYRVGQTAILESPSLSFLGDKPVFTRTLNVGPRSEDMVIQIANVPGSSATIDGRSVVVGDFETSVAKEDQRTSESLVFDGSKFAEISNGDRFDMTGLDYSIYAKIRTTNDGTIFAQTRDQDQWIPQGKTFFIRGGRPTFDIGWVGAVSAERRIDDGKWHEVVMTFNAKNETVTFFVDGEEEGSGKIAPEKRIENLVVRIGFTNENFPEASNFSGEIDELRFYQRQLNDEEVERSESVDDADLIGVWNAQVGCRFPEASGNDSFDAVVSGATGSNERSAGLVAATSLKKAIWSFSEDCDLRLTIPAGTAEEFTISHCSVEAIGDVDEIKPKLLESEAQSFDLSALTSGGPAKYPTKLSSKLIRGVSEGPFEVDVFERPKDNPWNCQLRLTGLDFLSGGDVAIVSAWDGSVWRVTGFNDSGNDLLTWQRIAAGLFQPLGVKCVGEQIYITCRDQIVKLHDLNGDHEADWYENFNSDHQVTEHFHEFAMGLQTDSEGNFYYAKSARHAKKAVVPHHGTLLKVSADGATTEIIANGFRAANGVCINDDGSFVVTDQEGHWNPKNRINWVRPGQFYGNMFGYHSVEDESDSAMEDPLCWITNSFDRSPGELLWVTSDKWGPLKGSLLNLSYGFGKAYIVPHEFVNGKVQGGMCELPLDAFPTGIMRGRFHPKDGQLYCCGMFAWAGNQQQPGGFYRIRYTRRPVHLPVKLQARKNAILIGFSDEVSPDAATDASNYQVKVWDLKRTKNYGSEHFNERKISIKSASLSSDGKSVELVIPNLEPTWGMEIVYSIKTKEQRALSGKIHNSIFELSE